MSKLRGGDSAFDTCIDNGLLEDANWTAEIENSEDIDYMTEHFYDYCYPITLLATYDIVPYIDGCIIGTEVDIFETFAVELMQEMIDKEEDDMLIFMEEEFDEGVETVTNHVEEEEIDPPMNFLDR